ncbi:MAG: TRAP transporter large permease subunit, partial [Hyphomicrobiaceae bacterium]|nr:TRAP transporter large permease subunit [Hyphomicrobiaceae bacterium]
MSDTGQKQRRVSDGELSFDAESIEQASTTSRTWRTIEGLLEGRRPAFIWLAVLAVIVGIGASIYHMIVPLIGAYDTFFLRPLHLLLIGGLGFITFDIRGGPRDYTRFHWTMLIDVALLALLCVTLLHVMQDPTAFENRFGDAEATRMDTNFGIILTLLVVELSRRTIGLPITIFVALMLAYALWGEHLWGFLRHRPIPSDDLFQNMYMTTFGIFGSPVGVMASYVFLFIIFGSFVERSKGGLLIQRVGLKMTGRSPGGPAKVAVVTSSMFGTMSGSALANVMAT